MFERGKVNLFLGAVMVMALLLCGGRYAWAAQEGDYVYTVENGAARITGYRGAGGSITIPTVLAGVKVSSIGSIAFKNCEGLTSVTIPEGITRIECEAFAFCNNLTSISLPASVSTIEISAFGYCSNLTSITVDNANLTYKCMDGVLYNKSGTDLLKYPGGLSYSNAQI